ncbi:MAG: GNAT family N-acetyltransferase [Acidimicrobiia bacterium]
MDIRRIGPTEGERVIAASSLSSTNSLSPRSTGGRGVGRSLVAALGKLAVERGCYGMWVGTEPDNIAAIATYQAAGAEQPEPSVTLTWTFSPV